MAPTPQPPDGRNRSERRQQQRDARGRRASTSNQPERRELRAIARATPEPKGRGGGATKGRGARGAVRAAPPVAVSQPWYRSRWLWPAVLVILALGAVGIREILHLTTPPPPAVGPPLAPASTTATGQPVDGVQCQSSEGVAQHIHAHLAVFVDGTARAVPAGIGFAPPVSFGDSDRGPFAQGGSCLYSLHSHTQDGVIHIESPDASAKYTLGQYFDIWRQPLDTGHVGPATGTVIAYLNGQRWGGNPRDIPLSSHALVQLDVGRDVAPQGYTFVSSE